jgi:Ethanolamine utilization protein EutJ (predicted chaperonin)
MVVNELRLPFAQEGAVSRAAAEAMEWLGVAFLVTQTSIPPESLTQEVRVAVASVSSTLPLCNVLTIEQVIDEPLASRHLNLWLLAIFAGIVLVVSASGPDPLTYASTLPPLKRPGTLYSEDSGLAP